MRVIRKPLSFLKGNVTVKSYFEEQFKYKDEKKHPLRLHLLKEDFMGKYPKLGESLGVLCIRKLLNDVTDRSKNVGVNDYREHS